MNSDDQWQAFLRPSLTKDVRDVTEIRKVEILKATAACLLTHSAQFVTLEELSAKAAISKETALNYMDAMRALYLFDRVPAFAKSDYEMIGKRPKWVATDAALMANTMGWTEEAVYLDENRNGKFIETWVYQQLAAIAEASGGYEITHYRDGRKREIDFIVQRDDGALLGIEVKAGAASTGDFKHLKWFAQNIAKGPFTGIVLHSGKDVLRFGEGFYSVPFGALA